MSLSSGAHRAATTPSRRNTRAHRGVRVHGGSVRSAWMSVSATLLVAGAVLIVMMVGRAPAAYAAQPAVGLGTATSFAVLAGSTVTNTGPSTVSGDLGVSPGTAVTGFPPGQVNSGVVHAADAVALQVQQDLTTAYNDAAGRSPRVDKTGDDLGGETLVPGVYNASSGMSLTGTVTLDAQGDPAAVFVFQAGSSLITASGSRVALEGGAQACNVFWQVGSSATIGTTTTFVGTVMALADITVQTNATVQGRVMARTGQVSLDTNVITRPTCAAAPPTTSATPTDTASPTGPSSGTTTTAATATPIGTASQTPAPSVAAAPSDGPGGPGNSGGPNNPDGPGDSGGLDSGALTNSGQPDGSLHPSWVPDGHPQTGRAPLLAEPSDRGLWLGGGMCILGAAMGVAAARSPKTVRLP